MTAPGGTLVYAVCSLEPEEGPTQIAACCPAARRSPRLPIEAAEVGGLAELLTPTASCAPCPAIWPRAAAWTGSTPRRLRRT